MPNSYDAVRARLEASIRLGIAAEEDWDGPSIKPGDLTDDQIAWLASWLAGDGCDKAREVRHATWADAATLMRDDVRRCNDDPAWDPCRKRLAQEYANAFQLYARDLGDPYRRIRKQLAREEKTDAEQL